MKNTGEVIKVKNNSGTFNHFLFVLFIWKTNLDIFYRLT